MIPAEIREIKRPKNTILQTTKKSNVFLVIQRIGCKYDKGRRLPVNGSVIGHIIDGVYIPKEEKRISKRNIYYKKYGAVAFCDSVGSSLLNELKKVYDYSDAINIYVLALLRTAFTDIKDYQIQDKYEKSWASELYPKAAVSKNSISTLLCNLGKSYDLIVKFMKQRFDSMVKTQSKILIDGMLKNNDSKVNSFSSFSYKGRIKGAKDISIICAIDTETKEPLCSKVYSGFKPDFVNCNDFIEEFNINNGLIISDKGFPLDKVYEKIKDGKAGYIHPIKRSEKKISELNLYKNLSPLKTVNGNILASKECDKNKGLYYYLFKDLNKSLKEEKDYVFNKKNKNFDKDKYELKKHKFGTICFISNINLELQQIYEYYRLRWEIELVFKMYKNVLDFKTTRENDDLSVVGSEFINYLSTIITCRMKNKIVEKNLFENYTFNEIIERLNDIIKVSTKDENWKLCSLTSKEINLLNLFNV